jgi:hypothetical protein
MRDLRFQRIARAKSVLVVELQTERLKADYEQHDIDIAYVAFELAVTNHIS